MFDTPVLYLLFSTICQAPDSDTQPSRTACVPLLPPPRRDKLCISSVRARLYTRTIELRLDWLRSDRERSQLSSPPFAATHAEDSRWLQPAAAFWAEANLPAARKPNSTGWVRRARPVANGATSKSRRCANCPGKLRDRFLFRRRFCCPFTISNGRHRCRGGWSMRAAARRTRSRSPRAL